MWRRRVGLIGAGCLATATAFSGRASCLKLELDQETAKSLRASLSAAVNKVNPPVARREPHTVYFGVNLADPSENRGAEPMDPPIQYVDDLHWIRDDERKSEEVLSLLKDENAYTNSQTAHLAQFREQLYAEMLSHIQEDDEEYPVPAADGYEYWARTVKGKSFRQYLRRKIGDAADVAFQYLDVNAVPSLAFFSGNSNWDPKQCDVQSIQPSPSGTLLAYCVDGSGYETYDVRLKDLSSGGVELDESIQDTAGSIAWAGDGTLFYTRHDKAHRPFQVWRHAIGTAQTSDALVFEDRDELFWVGVSTTRDGSLVVIESESKETMEVSCLLLDRGAASCSRCPPAPHPCTGAHRAHALAHRAAHRRAPARIRRQVRRRLTLAIALALPHFEPWRQAQPRALPCVTRRALAVATGLGPGRSARARTLRSSLARLCARFQGLPGGDGACWRLHEDMDRAAQ